MENEKTNKLKPKKVGNRTISVERQKEIQREKEKLRNELAETSINDIISETEDGVKGEKYYSNRFKIIYSSVRKGLVLIKKKKDLGMINNQEAYSKAIFLLNEFSEEEI